MKKHHGHTGHKHEIAKAHGHKPDGKPKANKPFGTKILADGIGHDSMAHHTHTAANAHHGMHEGMGPTGEHGTMSTKGSHLGDNEMHEDDYGGGDGMGHGMGDGDVGGEEHGGGESSEG